MNYSCFTHCIHVSVCTVVYSVLLKGKRRDGGIKGGDTEG